jgi:hypothetical protein
MCSEPLACYSTNVNKAIGTPKTQELLFGNGSVFLNDFLIAVGVPSSVAKTFSVRSINISLTDEIFKYSQIRSILRVPNAGFCFGFSVD